MSNESVGPWQRVADGVYRSVAEPETVNIGLVVGADTALLIDCGASPAHGAQIRATVATLTDRPLVAVAVTHGHHDHAYGLAAYADLTTIAHESVAAALATAGLAVPSRSIVVATALDLGGRRVEIAHLGEGHTAGDVVVVVPDANVVFAGDLIESAGPPQFGDDAVPGSWAATLDGVIGLMNAQTVLVPGHGDPVGREFVFEQRGRIAAQAAELSGPPQPNRATLPLA